MLLELDSHLGYLLGNLSKKSANVVHAPIKRYANLLHKIRAVCPFSEYLHVEYCHTCNPDCQQPLSRVQLHF